MDWEEKKESFDMQEILFDRLLMFQNPAAFKDFSQSRDGVKRGEAVNYDDIVNLPARRATKQVLHDEQMAQEQVRMRLRRSPTIGGNMSEFLQQSEEDLLSQAPLQSSFSPSKSKSEEPPKETPLVPLDGPSSTFEL